MSAHLPVIGFSEPYDTVDIGQFIRILRGRARTVLLFTAVAAIIALLHTLFAIPQFTAHGALYLGDSQHGGPSADDDGGTVNLYAYSTQSDVETQIELLTTGTLIERAVLETGLNTTLRPAGSPPLTYWRWRVFNGGKTKSFMPGPQSLQVVQATLVGHYRLETGPDNSYKLYAAGGLFHTVKPVLTGTIGQTAQGPDGALLVRFAAPDTNDGAPGAGPAGVKPGLRFNLDIVPPDALANRLADSILSVNAGGPPNQPTKLATLQFRWSDPYQASLFVNQMMQDYIATQLQWKTEEAAVTETFVRDQLSQASQRMAEANSELSAYQAQTGIIDSTQSVQAAVTQMDELQRQRSALLLKMQALQQLNAMFAADGGAATQDLISQADDPLLSALCTSLSQAEMKLSQLEAEFKDNAQDVKIQQAQITELRASIDHLIANDLKAAVQGLADFDQLIAANHGQLKDLPAEALKVESLKRTSDQLDQLYGLLTQKVEQAQISKAATIIDTRIVTPSQLPLNASSPRLAITVIAGTLAGFVAGLALVFAQHGFSGRFESEEQIRRSVALPVYGVVPRQVLAPPGSNSLIVSNGFNAFSEAFQLIKRNIYRLANHGRAVAVLVISANPQDGKTTIAANLAKSLADDGKRVLLLNCDVYAGRLQGIAKHADPRGLTDWLYTGRRPALQRWPNGNFKVLHAGRTKRAQKPRLDEAALAKIMDTLAAEFDYLVLDSPPLPIVSDGLLFGGFADLILSVINVSHTIRRTFELHKELIETLGKPHGLVINGTDGASYGDADAYFLGDVPRRQLFAGWFHLNL